MAEPPLHAIDAKAQARFWGKLPSCIQGTCWEWDGYRSHNGYGIFNVARNSFRAHRVSLYLATGMMPHDKQALHSCDNPACCNPDHLRWGSHAENQQDKVERGRVRGERNGRAKIDTVDAAFIRATDRSTTVLMEWFGLSKGQINKIRRGDGW